MPTAESKPVAVRGQASQRLIVAPNGNRKGFAVYRNGELLATTFRTRTEARDWTEDFCIRNGYPFEWLN